MRVHPSERSPGFYREDDLLSEPDEVIRSSRPPAEGAEAKASGRGERKSEACGKIGGAPACAENGGAPYPGGTVFGS
jgi:hypothetical protein